MNQPEGSAYYDIFEEALYFNRDCGHNSQLIFSDMSSNKLTFTTFQQKVSFVYGGKYQNAKQLSYSSMKNISFLGNKK